MADSFRYLTMALCAFNIGTLLALYERVGRFILPRTTIRLLLIACALFFVSVMVNAAARLGEPYRPRTFIAVSAVFLYVIALARLYRWFATEQGRRRRHDIVNEYAAYELHQLADLARALEEDPDHVGRYVKPTTMARVWGWLRHPFTC